MRYFISEIGWKQKKESSIPQMGKSLLSGLFMGYLPFLSQEIDKRNREDFEKHLERDRQSDLGLHTKVYLKLHIYDVANDSEYYHLNEEQVITELINGLGTMSFGFSKRMLSGWIVEKKEKDLKNVVIYKMFKKADAKKFVEKITLEKIDDYDAQRDSFKFHLDSSVYIFLNKVTTI